MEKNNNQKTVINIQSLTKYLVIVHVGNDASIMKEEVKDAVFSALDQLQGSQECNSDKCEQP